MVKGGLEIKIPLQHILAKSWGGGLVIEGGVISSEDGTHVHMFESSTVLSLYVP